MRGADDKHVADAGQHQGAERVVNHGLVVHRQQLLADGQGGRVQPAAGAAGEDDAFAWGHFYSRDSRRYSRGMGRGALLKLPR